ncbi:MAG: hypothetical protein AB7G75_13310 [Candidatus Binatia bacterium]
MFDINVLPQLIRRDVEHGETNLPPLPNEEPAVLSVDPSWRRQWQQAKQRLLTGESPALDRLDTTRKQYLARYLGLIGLAEFEMIVLGCSYAANHFAMPVAWRMCLLKQAYEDMQHAATYITRGCRLSGENYWNGIENLTYRKNIEALYPILHRDLGGFFAVIGLHTEAYPAETNILDALMIDPVLARWAPNEIAEEAGHLTFLYPAMREYLHSGTPEEQDQRKRQLVADNEMLLETQLKLSQQNAERFLVGKLGLAPTVMDAFAHIPERTRFIYQTIGLEEQYWPAWLRAN